MKYCFSRWFFLFVLVVWFLFIPSVFAAPADPSPGEPQSANEIIISQKTLARVYDPIIITGDLLPMMEGFKNDNFRLFAYNDNKFQVIPFQIDERDPDGQFIFTDGEAAGTDVDKGLFDYNDELVFMAKDSGSQVAENEWKKLSNKGVEILITDPVNASGKGWVYLMYFQENPPPLSSVDYVSFVKGQGEEIIKSDFYTMKYKEGATFYSHLSYPEKNGGNGENFFDRIKIRIKIRALFNVLRVNKTEEDMRDEVLGWKDGPVRALRYAQSFFTLLFDLAEPSMTSTTQFYAYLAHQPVRLTIPFNLKWVFSSFSISNFDWIFYGDLPGLKGGKAYSNKNLGGFQYTGNHPGQKFSDEMNTDDLVWGFAAKEDVGCWFPCLVLPELLYGIANLYVLDDDKLIDEPENVPGVIGAGMKIGMADVNKDIWSVLLKGSYQMALDTYFPRADMEIEKVDEWLNIRGFPLSIDISKEQGKEIVACTPALGKEGEQKKKHKKKKSKEETFSGVLTDIRGRKFTLDNIYSYFGSAEVTPRTYVGAKKGSGKKTEYFLLDFKDIDKIEHYIRDIDPVTGMKNPMFQKVNMSDGTNYDIMGCKPCGFSGELEDGRKMFFWNAQVKTVEFDKDTEAEEEEKDK